MDEHETYLGDGVYASFDGFQIWLAVNHHENKVVALEPSVLDRLYKYVEMLKEKNARSTTIFEISGSDARSTRRTSRG